MAKARNENNNNDIISVTEFSSATALSLTINN